METNRPVWTALAGTLAALGVSVLIYKASARADVSWWSDPVFWFGVGGLTAGAATFLWLLVPPWLTDRKALHARREQAFREGQANQRNGLDEILGELGQISAQLKGELRWGKRGGLFPNTAWTKNRHLVVGEAQALVEDAYEQAHRLDQDTIAAAQAELDARETQERDSAKRTVDAAFEAVRELRGGLEP